MLSVTDRINSWSSIQSGLNLERQDQLTVLFRSVVKLDEMIPHSDKAEMIEPCGISLGLRLVKGKNHEVVNGFLANLPISASYSGSYG